MTNKPVSYLIECQCGHEWDVENTAPPITCPECRRTNCYVIVGPQCPECGEPRPDDDRVRAGMKCSICAYGAGQEYDQDYELKQHEAIEERPREDSDDEDPTN
jgi:predicted Zn-ribbon and HTH transcriptional regulator